MNAYKTISGGPIEYFFDNSNVDMNSVICKPIFCKISCLSRDCFNGYVHVDLLVLKFFSVSTTQMKTIDIGPIVIHTLGRVSLKSTPILFTIHSLYLAWHAYYLCILYHCIYGDKYNEYKIFCHS